MMTSAILGFHNKPIALLNTLGYYDHLIDQIHHTTAEGFMDKRYAEMLIIDTDVNRLLKRMQEYTPPIHKWC